MYNRIKATNWSLVTITLIVYSFMGMAAYISFTDIRTLAIRWGVPAALAWTAPIFIDGLVWMGKIGRSEDFDQVTRTSGLVLMALGGTGSLIANVAVGETPGMRVYGALVVAGFVISEWFSTRIKGSPKRKPETNRPAYVVTQAEKDARKAAGYAKMSPQAKAQWTMKYRARQAKKAATVGATTP